MRIFAAAVLALMAATSQPVMAAEADNAGPLAPGKPAGIEQADLNNHQLFIYITIGGSLFLLVGSYLLLAHSSKPAAVVSSPSTTTSP